jgi:superfamily II DNA or RNA helicase
VREQILSDFRRGRLQFVCNFGVLTEGYDLPDIGVVAMARPTRSEGVYTQMLGRGTRPLEGVVDGPQTGAERRTAIANSPKPFVKVMDFVGNSRHKLVSAVDVLGGNYDVQVRELAAERIKHEPQDVQEALEKAQKTVLEERERRRLAAVKAVVKHSSETVDPFGRGEVVGENGMAVQRGGASDSQVQFLVNLGVQRETALRYSKRQASAVIDKMKETHCTAKMKRVLERAGFPTDGVGMDLASKIIDAICQSGYRLKYESRDNPFRAELEERFAGQF